MIIFHTQSFELRFFANSLFLIVLKNCKIKIGGQVQKYYFDFFHLLTIFLVEGAKRWQFLFSGLNWFVACIIQSKLLQGVHNIAAVICHVSVSYMLTFYKLCWCYSMRSDKRPSPSYRFQMLNPALYKSADNY